MFDFLAVVLLPWQGRTLLCLRCTRKACEKVCIAPTDRDGRITAFYSAFAEGSMKWLESVATLLPYRAKYLASWHSCFFDSIKRRAPFFSGFIFATADCPQCPQVFEIKLLNHWVPSIFCINAFCSSKRKAFFWTGSKICFDRTKTLFTRNFVPSLPNHKVATIGNLQLVLAKWWNGTCAWPYQSRATRAASLSRCSQKV